MSQEKFKKMLVILAENFNHPINENKIKTLTQLAKNTIGFDHTWEKITLKIAEKEKYFPNLATIKSHLEPTPIKIADLSVRQQATSLVDQFIGFLQGLVSREEFGVGRASYFQKKLNADRFAFASGQISLEFRRREWIETIEIDLMTAPKCEFTQIHSAEIKNLIENISKPKDLSKCD